MQYLGFIIGLLLICFSIYQAISLGKAIYHKRKAKKDKDLIDINNSQ